MAIMRLRLGNSCLVGTSMRALVLAASVTEDLQQGGPGRLVEPVGSHILPLNSIDTKVPGQYIRAFPQHRVLGCQDACMFRSLQMQTFSLLVLTRETASVGERGGRINSPVLSWRFIIHIVRGAIVVGLLEAMK